MRAAVLQDGSSQLSILNVEVSAPVGREVLIRTMAVGLCHSDAHVMEGVLVRPRPMVMGHEGVGVVAAVGPDVRNLVVGDHVVTCLVMGCGECSRCERGEPGSCLRPEQVKRASGQEPRLRIGNIAVGQMANIGALAEAMLLDERGAVKIDADVPFTLAAILGCAVVTGVGAALNSAKVAVGDTVAVIGCGGVGLNVIQGAKIAGASRIIAIDTNANKFATARAVGATDVVDASSADAVAMVHELTGGGVDHAFEVVGNGRTVRAAFEMTAPGRAAYAVGVHADAAEVTIPAVGLRRGRSLVGVNMGDTQPSIDIPAYIEHWRAGRLDLQGMISHVVPLDDVNRGFAMMAAGESARTVVSLED
jgi:S-(hydroxymethyl)glutathione dehydrogenase / alcohol dehydrogenase